MEQINEKKVEYTPYEQLPTLTEEQCTNVFIQDQIMKLQESPQWMINYQALSYFRSLNKQNPSLYKPYIQLSLEQLTKLSVSIRSGIMKLTLILLGEILKHYQIVGSEDYPLLNKITYIVLHSIFNSKSFIRTEAKNILFNNVGNSKQYETMEYCIELIDLMKNDKPVISDTAFEVYQMIITKINLGNITKECWINLVNKLDELHDKKREIYVKKVVKIISFLFDKIGKENIQKILVEINKGEKFDIYEQWMKQNVKKTTANMSFKDFKKQQLAKAKGDNNQ